MKIVLCIFLLLVLVQGVQAAAPVANFVGTPTSGTAPLTVIFTDLSIFAPTSWSWTFGDGSIVNATMQNPVHTYTSAGTYSISLTVTNGYGSNTKTSTNYITVSVPAPVTNFVGTPTSGTAPLPVQFTDTSTGSPTGWAWFFGDETYTQAWTQQTASAGWSARSSFSSVVMPDGSIVLMGGGYNDVWRSTDKGATWTQMTANAGWSVRRSFSSVVIPDGSIVLMGGYPYSNDVWRSTDKGATWTQMTASAGWSGRSGHTSVAMPDGSLVLMGGAYYNIGNSGYPNDVWQSTDKGATWTQMTASAGWSGRSGHTSVVMPDGSIVLMGGYVSAGKQSYNYNNVWRSIDKGATWTQVNASAGWSVRSSFSSVVIPDGSIVLMGGYPYSNDVWRFTTIGSSAQNPSHTYTMTGSYPVALQAYNTGGYSSTRTISYITVSAPPVANFTANVSSGTAPLSVQFNDTSLNIPTAWNWSFGDGSLASVQNPIHRYATAGIYTVSLMATNTHGSNTKTSFNYITVNVPAPIANFTATPTSGTVPLTVTFTDTSTGLPTSWYWTFGDGSVVNATIHNPVHTYASAGTYSVSLTATNTGGSNTKTSVDYITVNVPAPIANFTGTPTSGTVPLTVTFTDTSTGLPTSWYWTFWDGSIVNATMQNPVHTYASAGTYSVSLTATNASGSNTKTVVNYITVTTNPQTILLVSGGNTQSAGYTSIQPSNPLDISSYSNSGWSSAVAVSDVPSVWYNNNTSPFGSGTIWVSSAATTEGGIGDQWRLFKIDFNIPQGSTIRSSQLWYTADDAVTIYLNDVEINSTGFVFGTAPPDRPNLFTNSYTVNFNPTIGSNTLKFVVRNWENTVYNPTGLLYKGSIDCGSTPVSPPVASFTGTPTSGTAPLTITFTDSSTNTPTSWSWSFGDGSSVNATQQNPVHTYTNAGTYTVALTATNSAGSNTLTMTNYITVTTSPVSSKSTIGMYRNGVYYLRNTNTAGNADLTFTYGTQGDIPVTGDWTGKGYDSVGMYRNGVYYLRNSNTAGNADLAFAYGSTGDIPVTGDWTGKGYTSIGMYRNGVYYLRNTNTAGNADLAFAYGSTGDIPVTGDWNGDGIDTVGMYRNGVYYLRNTNTAGNADLAFTYGTTGDIPVTGKWV